MRGAKRRRLRRALGAKPRSAAKRTVPREQLLFDSLRWPLLRNISSRSNTSGSYITAGFMILGLAILSTIPTPESWEEMIRSKMTEEEEADVNVTTTTFNSKL